MDNKNFNNSFRPKVDISSISSLIVQIQKKSGNIPWYNAGNTDPWDHVESAMGLAISGRLKEAFNAFKWLKNIQREDGSWYSSYRNEIPKDKTKETNMSSYIAVGVFHYWLITEDYEFLEFMWDTVSKAINFVVDHQGPGGEIYWAISPKGNIDTKALLTASSSVFMSLKCAIALSYELDCENIRWKIALEKLKQAILYKSFLFDSSKRRFSMDWFYPVLCGVFSGELAYDRIYRYWDKFVVDNLGVRCVADEPWITIAETSELILSLNAMGNIDLARSLFDWIIGRVFDDGSFWCGFTFPDITLWPIEKITWNNAVVLMATDALYDLTQASNMFKHDWWKDRYNI